MPTENFFISLHFKDCLSQRFFELLILCLEFFNFIKNKRLTCAISADGKHLSVNEVGYSLDFNDPYHFLRVFKRFHSLSPSHYKQMYMM
jgi:AraC-like DNA-binding protein